MALVETAGNVTLADFDTALQSIQFSPGAADGARTVTWAAHEIVNTSPTVTTTIDVGPILNSMKLDAGEGGTTILTNGDFNVSDPGFTSFTYSVSNVAHGEFEVLQGGSWQAAPTGGFTTADLTSGDVRFVQDGSNAAPTFSVHVSDGSNASADIAPTVNFTAPMLTLDGLTGSNAVEGQQITVNLPADAAASGAVYTWTVGGTTAQTGSDNTYTPQEADEGQAISVAVSFTDSNGDTESGSVSGGKVAQSPADATLSLTGLDVNNNAVEGQQVTAAVNDPTAGSGITYTWTVGGNQVTPDGGPGGNTYTPTVADEGQAISVSATFTDAQGNSETPSASAGTVQPPPITSSAPVVTFEGASEAAVSFAPDNLLHDVFPTVTITDPVSFTIDHASLTWNVTGGGGIAITGPGFDTHNISIAIDPSTRGYLLTGPDTLADYADVIDHLTFQTWYPQTSTFTIVVNDGTGSGDSTPVTSTVSVAVPSNWDVWTGVGADGDWNDAANWSLGTVPGSSDYAYVDAQIHNEGQPATVSDDLTSNRGDQFVIQLHVLSGTTLDILNTDSSYSFHVTGVLNSGDQYLEAGQNAGTIDVHNATLDIAGLFDNSGSMFFDTGATWNISGDVKLQGGGVVTLSDAGDRIVGSLSSNDTLDNDNNTINGFGDIGGGQLTLINETNGVITATDASHQLKIDLGDGSFTNHGLVASGGEGGLEVLGGVTSDGKLEADTGLLKIDGAVSGGGQAVIQGGAIEFGGASDAHVQFSANASASGTLVLDDVADFTGSISGITMHGDTIHLVNEATVSLDYNAGALELHYGTGPGQFLSVTGGIVASAGADSPNYFSEYSDGNGGTNVVFDRGPVIATDNFDVTGNPNGTTTITGLSVSEDNNSANQTYTVTATTGAAGSSVTPSPASGSLTDINNYFATGVTYNPGSTPPATDKVTGTVTDSFGATDAVNFVFNEAGTGPNIVLQGTAGKDVIFATGSSDTLTGGGGQDQFVFKPNFGPNVAQHTITDFVDGLDKIDIRQFSNVSATTLPAAETQQGNDTLITLDSHDNLLLKNVVVANLHNSDFIFHA